MTQLVGVGAGWRIRRNLRDRAKPLFFLRGSGISWVCSGSLRNPEEPCDTQWVGVVVVVCVRVRSKAL